MLSPLVRIGTTVVVLGLLTTSAFAQGRGGAGGGPGGRGGFGRVGGGASDLMGMLEAPEVRKEVKLSDEGYAAIEKLQKEIDEARQAMFANFRTGQDRSEADREKARAEGEKRSKENNEKAQAILDEVLPPEGLNRLMGLYVQWRGDVSITGELVSKKLGLSDADKTKINEAAQKAREEAMAALRPGGDAGGAGGRPAGGGRPGGDNAGGRPARGGGDAAGGDAAGGGRGAGGGPGGFDLERIRTMMAETQKKTNEAVGAILTDAQKKDLTELKGAKFEIPKSLDARVFGGFGGGQGGRGGAGARPGA